MPFIDPDSSGGFSTENQAFVNQHAAYDPSVKVPSKITTEDIESQPPPRQAQAFKDPDSEFAEPKESAEHVSSVKEKSFAEKVESWWNDPERVKSREQFQEDLKHPLETVKKSLTSFPKVDINKAKKIDPTKLKKAEEDAMDLVLGWMPVQAGATLTWNMFKGHLNSFADLLTKNSKARQEVADSLVAKGHTPEEANSAIDKIIKHKEQPAMGAVERKLPTEEKGLTPAKSEYVRRATERYNQAAIDKEFPLSPEEEARRNTPKALDTQIKESIPLTEKDLPIPEDVRRNFSRRRRLGYPDTSELPLQAKAYKGERGGIDPSLLRNLAIHLGASAVGAYIDTDNPIEGAALGLSAGFLASRGLKGLKGIIDTNKLLLKETEGGVAGRASIPFMNLTVMDNERQLQAGLHMLDTQNVADKLILNKHVEESIKSGVTPEIDRKFRDYSEGTIELNTKGKKLYDETVGVMKKLASELREKLNPGEAEAIEDDLRTKIALGHSSWLDDITNDTQFSMGTGGGAQGKRFTGKPGSMKSMTTFETEDGFIVKRSKPKGENNYKYTFWKNGQLVKTEFSKARLGVKDTLNGIPLKRAQQSHVEEHTPSRYVQSDLATWKLRTEELLRYSRQKEFLDQILKSKTPSGEALFIHESDPRFKDFPGREVNESQGSLQQFRGYKMPSTLAETLEDYARTRTAGPLRQAVTNLVLRSFMLNFFPHFNNEFVHWMAGRGVTGLLPGASKLGPGTSQGLEGLLSTMPKALMATIGADGGKFVSKMLDEGASLMQPSRKAALQNQKILQMTMKEAVKTKDFKQIAISLGISPFRLVKSISDASGSIMWGLRDTLYTQLVMEHMTMGKTMKEAIEQVDKHMPTYQLPSRMFRGKIVPEQFQRWSAQAMQEPSFMFMRYKYGMFRSIGEIGKELSQIIKGTKQGTKEFIQGLDRLGALLGMWYFMYPILDKAYQEFTGKKNVQARRAGALHVAEKAQQSFETDDPKYLAMALLVPDPSLTFGYGMLEGKDPYSGRDISREKLLENQFMPMKDFGELQKKQFSSGAIHWEIAKVLDAEIKRKLKKRRVK